MRFNFYKSVLVIVLVLTLITGCANTAESSFIPSQPTSDKNLDVQISEPALATNPIIQSQPLSIWAPDYLAATINQGPKSILNSLLIENASDTPDSASLKLEVGDQNLISEWIYVVVAPFPSLTKDIQLNDLLLIWKGQTGGPFAGQPLIMDENTYGMLSSLWGQANPSGITLINQAELVDYTWSHPSALAIVPFEALNPRWKVLSVDGISLLHKDFDQEKYPLKVPISLNGDQNLINFIKANFSIPSSNRDPQKLTVVAMTGVTALVRATAFTMEQQGITYPDQDIRELLRNVDLTHISNEVPFAEDCPYPDPMQANVKFCSRDSYIQLLEDVGTDVVELSGDHFQDWGEEAVFHTLDLYRNRGWSYYGGGIDLAEGRKALLLDHNNNRIAFIGCNGKGGSFAQANETNPGAAACDMEWMANEITRLKQDGYLVIATFQHQEYYSYAAQEDQKRDFGRMASAGADIVSGSQAHQPQAMAFQNNSFIHYGLGNLFFDQYDLSPACRQATIDIHVFYDGRYISTELFPIEFVDYARSRPMTDEEANSLFQSLFAASGW